MFDNSILITKIEKIILVDGNKQGKNRSNYNSFLPFNEIYCCFSGSSTVQLNKSSFDIEPGDVVFLSQGEHKKYTTFRRENGITIDIYFTTDKPIMVDEYRKISCTSKIKIQALFQKAFKVWVAKNDGYYYKCVGILYEILSLLQEKNYLPGEKYNTIKAAVTHIENHFTDKGLNYNKLADMCGISYGYFKRLFVEKFGVTPTKYVTLLRINYACDLLKTGDYSVSEVATLVGIEDIYYFSKFFKKEVGISPSKYK